MNKPTTKIGLYLSPAMSTDPSGPRMLTVTVDSPDWIIGFINLKRTTPEKHYKYKCTRCKTGFEKYEAFKDHINGDSCRSGVTIND